MLAQFLDLPPELIEHILALLTHQDAPSLSACRRTCRALDALIARSPLVRYIERAALLGVYDPFVPSTTTTTHADPTTMTIPERAEALEAWNDAWTNLDEILRSRPPDGRFAMPSRHELRSGRTAQVVVSSSVPGPEACRRGTVVGRQERDQERDLQARGYVWEEEVVVDEEDEDEDEDDCHFSFGPWFVAAAREGPGVRGAGYSYLDVRANLGADEGDEEEEEGTSAGGGSGGCWPGGKGLDGQRWTTIQVPVRNLVVFALSTELDLAVAISYVVHTHTPLFFLFTSA
jgi:hypothetical protein